MEFQGLGNWSEDYFKHRVKRPINLMIFSWWDEIVGDTIAQVTQPIYFKQGILGVEVMEDGWRAELGYHTASIIQKYRERISRQQLGKTALTMESIGTTDSINTIDTINIKGIHFKYNPYMEKKAKPTKTIASEKTEIDKSTGPLEQEVLSEDNLGGRMNVLLGKLQDYADGKNLRPSPPLTPFHPPTEPTMPAPSRPSQHRISLYYPDTGLYSEFILPPDELQNFDLY